MFNKNKKEKFTWIRQSLSTHKKPIFISSTSLTFANVLEGVSIISILPLIQLNNQFEQTDKDNKIINFLNSVFDFFNVPMDLSFLLLFIWVLLLTKLIISYFTFLYIGNKQAEITANNRKNIVKSYLECGWTFICKNQVGEISNLISNITDKASRVFINLSRFIATFFQLLVYLFFSLYLNYKLTLLCILLGVLMYLIIKKFISISSISSKNINRAVAKLSGIFTDNIHGLKSVKSMSKESLILPHFFDLINSTAQSQKKIIVMKRIVILFQELFIISLVLLSFYLFKSLSIKISVSEIIVIMIFSIRSLQQFSSLQRDIQSLAIIKVPFEYFQNYKEMIENNRELSGRKKLVNIKSIEFKKVSCVFGKRKVFSNLSFKVKKGQIVCIFGPSGIGKSSLVDMMTGLLKSSSGKILISGCDINSIDLNSLRNMIGYVGQETFLFNNDLKYNISLDDKKVKIKDINLALNFSELQDFIKLKSEGLNFLTGEKGQFLSGGERQRICIARAIANNPKLLIMDEPTSALDNDTEKKIFDKLSKFKNNKIIIIITHKKNFLKKADHIIYLNKNN